MNNNEILSVDDIRRIYFEETGEIDEKCKNAFEWHLKHDKDPFEVINMIDDVALCDDDSVNYLAPEVLKFIDKDDGFIGMEVVSCILSSMRLTEYVPFFLEFFYQKNKLADDENIKSRILFSLGRIVNNIKDLLLQQSVAQLLLDELYNPSAKDYEYDAYRSILESLEIDGSHMSGLDFNREKDIDWNIVDQFRQKYLGYN